MGHLCVPVEHAEDEADRARRDPTAGARVVAIARAQWGRSRQRVGVDLETHPFALHRYLEPEEWWCGDFVSWVYEAAGVGFTGGGAGGWHVGNNVAIRAWFEARGRWVDRDDPRWATFVPSPGDYVRFRTDRGGHAAIVSSVEDQTLYTIEGNVGFRVDVGRYRGFRGYPEIDGFGILALPNQAPEVDAGDELARVRPGSLVLRGQATDDGPTARLVTRWSMHAGPAEVACDRPSALETECHFDVPGTYVLRLTAEDGEHTIHDDVRVVVTPNRTPEVSIALELLDAEHAELRGTVIDDEAVRTWWSVEDGPGEVRLDALDATHVTARFDAPGRYVLRLHADDGQAIASAEHALVVPAPSRLGCTIARASRDRTALVLLLVPIALGVRARRRREPGDLHRLARRQRSDDRAV